MDRDLIDVIIWRETQNFIESQAPPSLPEVRLSQYSSSLIIDLSFLGGM